MANKIHIKKDINIKNKVAYYNYSFIDKYTAGLVLKGTEIKSIKMGKINLQDSFCVFESGEFWVRNMHIAQYSMSNFVNHITKADRKLLLNKQEIKKLKNKLKDKGLTVIPVRLFVTERGFAKLQIALAKGKKLFDKRNDIKEKDVKREMSRNLKY